MKKYYLSLLFLGCMGVASQGQNAMFVSFKEKPAYNNVKEWLSSNPAVKLNASVEGEQLLADANGFRYQYDFYNGHLYRVSMQKTFGDEKIAAKAAAGCLQYFQQIRAVKVESANLGNAKKYVAVKDDRVFEVATLQHNLKQVSVELSVKAASLAPAYEQDKFTDLATLNNAAAPVKP